jgi:ribosome biogenesis ATPase
MNAVQFKNRPNALDPSLRGTDHFDQEISLGISYLAAREKFLKVVCKNLSLPVDMDCKFEAGVIAVYGKVT